MPEAIAAIVERQPARRWRLLELGAGTAVPTVRRFGASLGGLLIRINPDEPQLEGARGVALPENALPALQGIAAALAAQGWADSSAKTGA